MLKQTALLGAAIAFGLAASSGNAQEQDFNPDEAFAVPPVCDQDMRNGEMQNIDNMLDCTRALLPIAKHFGTVAAEQIPPVDIADFAANDPAGEPYDYEGLVRATGTRSYILESCVRDILNLEESMQSLEERGRGQEIPSIAVLGLTDLNWCFSAARDVMEGAGYPQGAELERAAERAFFGHFDGSDLLVPEGLDLGPIVR